MMYAWTVVVSLFMAQSAADVYQQANAQFQQRNLEGALTTVEQALRLDAHFVPALILKARLEMAASRLDDAQRDLEAALAADSKQPYPRFLLGFLFYLKNDFERARDTLAVADPNDARVTFYQAMTEEALGNGEAAAAQYERTLRLDKSASEPRVAYARLLFSLRRLDRGEAVIDEALKIEPNGRDALYEKGRCLFERGEYIRAADFGERALAEVHGSTMEREIRYLLVRTYLAAGNRAMADKHRAVFEKLPAR
jgi:tetratricopeptide (TPR) repeat protein